MEVGTTPAEAGTGTRVASRAVYRPPWRIDVTVRPGAHRVVPIAELARTAATALDAAGAPRPASIGLILSDDRELAGLNETYMGASGPTDVLSFPLLPPTAFPAHPRETAPGGPSSAPATPAPATPAPATFAPATFALPPRARLHLGDIVVSVERAIEQAEAGRGGWSGDLRWAAADELRLLVTHGAFHVCGWDHAEPIERAAMRALEARVLGVDVPR